MSKHLETSICIAAMTLVALAVFSRLIPHLPNWTTMGAAALLAGATLWPRWMAFAVPLLALVISDFVLGFHSTVPFVYGAFALTVWIGSGWLRTFTWWKVGACSLVSTLNFYLISNFGVWWVGGLYPHSASGLALCYEMGLPFLNHQIVGDLFFSFALFAVMAFVRRGSYYLFRLRA